MTSLTPTPVPNEQAAVERKRSRWAPHVSHQRTWAGSQQNCHPDRRGGTCGGFFSRFRKDSKGPAPSIPQGMLVAAFPPATDQRVPHISRRFSSGDVGNADPGVQPYPIESHFKDPSKARLSLYPTFRFSLNGSTCSQSTIAPGKVIPSLRDDLSSPVAVTVSSYHNPLPHYPIVVPICTIGIKLTHSGNSPAIDGREVTCPTRNVALGQDQVTPVNCCAREAHFFD